MQWPVLDHTLNKRLSDDDKKQLIKDYKYAPAWIADIMKNIARHNEIIK